LADLSWEWDETLYAGSAPYYARGRLPYPPALADAFRDALGLDGTGRLLDVGCGPGSLTHLLAPLFAEAVGVDADAAMAAEAAKTAAPNERFVVLRAEELPAGLGAFRAATFAQSFHWLDQRQVAAAVHELLEPGGAAVLVGATTHQGEVTDVPREAISELVHRYLGPVRRAGRGSLPQGTAEWDFDAFSSIGFSGPREVEVPAGQVYERSEDDVVASVYSTSSAAPHLFGDRLEEFESELRAILRRASPEGRFRERARDISLRIWDR
jgi:SAM-dependent methyltransferase